MASATIYYVLFDGVCNLCNSSVQFIIKRDRKGIFRFASLQSEFGQGQLSRFSIDGSKMDSVILIKAGRVFMYSSAALEITRHLRGAWPLFYVFKIIPPFIRDFFYQIVAKNRYKWFGKKESCMVPNQELKGRFIE
jgi:predicted DCC family thiol-disulfide oxidoreductase YuxK